MVTHEGAFLYPADVGGLESTIFGRYGVILNIFARIQMRFRNGVGGLQIIPVHKVLPAVPGDDEAVLLLLVVPLHAPLAPADSGRHCVVICPASPADAFQKKL